MVGLARFELTTSCTPCKRSTRLNYSPTLEFPSGRTRREGDFGASGPLCNPDIEFQSFGRRIVAGTQMQQPCHGGFFDPARDA